MARRHRARDEPPEDADAIRDGAEWRVDLHRDPPILADSYEGRIPVATSCRVLRSVTNGVTGWPNVHRGR
jgi:hypothetical protein